MDKNSDNKTSKLSSKLEEDTLNPTSFGSRVQLCREKLGLSQESLATKVGVSGNTIQSYEKGNYPKGKNAIELAKIFEVSLDWLLMGIGRPQSEKPEILSDISEMTRSNYELDPLSRAFIYPHERLEFLRIQKGWTQESLAATARVPVAKVKELESPSVSEDISAITMIADVLFVSLEWLLTGEGPRQKFAATPQEDGYRQRCEQLEAELVKEREENRALNKESRELMRENGDLRVELERMKARAAPDQETPNEAHRKAG
ncbi:helix-turn-helix transcriptional regulator [Maridesulfovibrio sp.]|uniref:helix-turn-helix transcriptional regulator n=1 Tax=Maridesulfovibrio sp. TaxID=2795000 RepID=UPI002A187200|nr:helix-turn-helix transcriptional regulator [Maridesulfovibrio sp.]